MADPDSEDMKKISFLLALSFLSLIMLMMPAIVWADTCNLNTNVACNRVWQRYTWYGCTGAGQYQSCQWQSEMREMCQIPQSGGGSCSCCWPDGCYLNCPGTSTGGGGGGATDTPTPTRPPNITATPTLTPTPIPACQNMYYCNTNTYSCNLTSSQYSTTSPYPICGSATPTCSQNLATYLPGQTTGSCFTDLATCQFNCTPPPGTVRMRAVVVPEGTNTCADVTASTRYTPIDITLFPEGVAKTTSSDGSYITWANSPSGTKSFLDSPPADYVLTFACYNTTSQPAYSSGYTATLPSSETLTWQLGYTGGVGWFQAQGGDVYAATQLRSYVPASAIGGRYLVKDGNTGGTPGIVTFGTSADMDAASGNGYGYVSTKNWLVKETQSGADFYAIMYHRFGSPTTADYPGGTTFTSKIASRTEPYYVNGDLIVDTADWTVGNGETITVLVNGSLMLNKKINITGTGFVAFIVNGDITVGSGVGTTAASSTPVIEGIYITSSAGTFRTGSSTTVAARKFVGKGTFIAGTFALERDLDADALNINYPADLFIYNPELMLRMPDKMKDLPVSWQEVAP